MRLLVTIEITTPSRLFYPVTVEPAQVFHIGRYCKYKRELKRSLKKKNRVVGIHRG